MSDPAMAPPQPAVHTKTSQATVWVLPVVRVFLVAGAAFLVWYVAGHWNRWTGAARYELTDDAYMFGDVTPLSAKVSGYVEKVAVGDYQAVRKGDLIVQIEHSDYRAALEQAEAGLAAAQATLANLANQKDIQRSLIRQAEATIEATTADLERYTLEGQASARSREPTFAGTRSFSSRPRTTRSGPRPSCSSTTRSSISKRRCSRASTFRKSSWRRRWRRRGRR